LTLLQKEVESHPQDAELLSELATLYAQQAVADKAQTLIATALALAPENSTILINAAEVQEELGNRAEAIRYGQQGLRKGFSRDDLKKRYALQALLADPNFKAQPSR